MVINVFVFFFQITLPDTAPAIRSAKLQARRRQAILKSKAGTKKVKKAPAKK
jgi:hypothetical protein